MGVKEIRKTKEESDRERASDSVQVRCFHLRFLSRTALMLENRSAPV